MKSSTHRKNRTGIVFLLIFIILAAGILTGGYFAFRNYEQSYRMGVEHQISAIAELKVNQLVEYRKERFGDASILFRNPAFSDLVRRFFEKTNNADAQRQLQIWLAKYRSHYQYDRVILLDTRGVARMSAPDTPEPIAATIRKNATEVLHSKEVTFQDFYRDEHNQKIYLALLIPIIDDIDHSRRLGVLVLRLDPFFFIYPFLEEWPVPSRTSETLIIRREGNDAVFLNELRFQKNTALNLRTSIRNERMPAVKAALGQQGIIEGVDYRGVPVIADVRPVPDSPWFLVARTDESEVYEPVRAQLWLMIILLIALITAAGGVVGLVWRHQRIRFYREQLKSAEALRESEERLNFHINNSPMATVEWDSDFIVKRWAGEVEKIFGWSQAETIGKPIMELHMICEEDIPIVQRTMERLTDRTSNYVISTNRNYTKDGKVIYCEWYNSVFLNPQGKMVSVLSQVLDITERKQAEEALRETNEYLENLFNYANAPIIVWDPTLVITRFNHAFEHLSGYSAEEVTGKKIDVLFSKEQIDSSLKLIKRAVGGERWETVEIEIQRKDGDLRIVLWNSANILDKDGKTIVATIAQGHDITGRKQAEEALRETNEYLENLFNHANAPIIVWNPTLVITRFNHAFEYISGYTAEEVTGKKIDVLFRKEKIDSSLNLINRAVSGERWETVEIDIQRKDGDSRIVLWNSANILDKDGTTVIATIAQGHDITARKRAEADARSLFETSERSRSDLLSILEDQKRAEEEIQTLNAGLETRVVERTSQLEAANKELEAFSYSVSHDLRAPLRAIDGFSRIVAEEYAKKLDAEGNRLLNVICANTKKMDELITDLLNLSRVSRDEMKDARVDMSKLAKSTYSEAASPDVQQQYEFSVEPLPEAYCDPALVRQVWTNLISNAIKFTATKDVRTIEIGSRTEDGMNIYFVKDSGVGFDPQYTSKLFGVFQRLHKSEDFEGTGIGLAIVQRIIHRHGGKVWAEGKVGEGATFYFSLPSGRQ